MKFSMKNTMMVCKVQHEDYAGEGREEEEGRKEEERRERDSKEEFLRECW